MQKRLDERKEEVEKGIQGCIFPLSSSITTFTTYLESLCPPETETTQNG